MKDDDNKKSSDAATSSTSLQGDVMRTLLYNYEGNWTEDFSQENGNYMNICIRCDQEFLGYKGRVICKKCYELRKR